MSRSNVSEGFSNLALAECREKTFLEWPYKNGKCTAKEMAKAGFHVTKSDQQAVTCYFCFKELEGWEKNDDPFTEHKKHAPYCGFVKMFDEAPDTITFAQLLKLELARQKRAWELEIDHLGDNVQEMIKKSLKGTVKRRYKKRK
ncbi:baculoviral IAP repeat-containing protein 5 isoform X2 [Halyomorpha halys]|uniref:baculoviral IAP repeat-containing protein 5 isoform X2 n=1 Tax=Halyomorpha halys TaxID=286706 RepID=UPI0006D4F20F|nr:baculoviral IAP repeat-containing protein 5 [Halyomorpha halys]